jgi:eukaryotic-like serine/threonine-protein kinase
MSFETGAMLGPYKVVQRLGEGGMGEVYRARDERLSRDVAIKVLHAGAVHDPESQRRFAQEARAVSALNHPNILTVHDIGIASGWPYIVTELIDGDC